jgi:NADH dehydrogenase FAD-containing subunit
MGKHLVLVGGGHAHMVTLANLHKIIKKGHNVTVIGPSTHHYYSGMGPGMLSKTYTPDDIRFSTKHVVEKQGASFVLDAVTKIDPKDKTVYLASATTLSYDVLSFNAGSHVPQMHVSKDTGDIFSVKPIEKLVLAQKRILELAAQGKITIGIVGGGPSAAEIAGNIWQLAQESESFHPYIQIFAGKKFMSHFPKKIEKRTRASLTRRGINILETGYVNDITTGSITTEAGQRYRVDLVFLALGVKPSPIFVESGLPVGPDGGLLVNRYLQSTAYPELFGGGDCIYFADKPLDKVGVYAVRENPILYHNLLASLEGTELIHFDPGGSYLLIFNLGGGHAVLRKNGLVYSGRFAFRIKDYIDRKFMKKFQAIE